MFQLTMKVRMKLSSESNLHLSKSFYTVKPYIALINSNDWASAQVKKLSEIWQADNFHYI